MFLKHLLRGVSLGLFDEAAAMEKFTKWSTEHDATLSRRQGAHRKANSDRRNVPVVKKVAEITQDAPVPTPVADAQEVPEVSEEAKTEE